MAFEKKIDKCTPCQKWKQFFGLSLDLIRLEVILNALAKQNSFDRKVSRWG